MAPDRSLNFGWIATWPVTVAPARAAACLTPVITVDEAPGSVTSTMRSPGSVLASSFGSALREELLVVRDLLLRERRARALDWSSWFLSEFWDVRRTSMVLPCSSVEPSTMPIASARNTATIETR